jgi:TonB-dependent receptor
MRKGNPDLEITEAINLDLMGEHYFTGVGILSGGFFFKDIKDFSTEIEEDIDNPDSRFDGWEYRGPANAGDAKLYGIEVNWWQQLNFLPGYLAGFGIYANYTHTWIKSDLSYVNPFEKDKRVVREGFNELPGQAGDVGNVALSYEWGPFSSRFGITYQDKYLTEPGGADDGSEDIYRESQLTLDISASYKIIPELDLFAEFVNLGDEPEIDFYNFQEKPYKIEYYGWWMRAGLRFSM